jgi:hypothetical protein
MGRDSRRPHHKIRRSKKPRCSPHPGRTSSSSDCEVQGLTWLVQAGSANSRIRYRCPAARRSSRFVTQPTTSPACRKRNSICRNGKQRRGSDASVAQRPDDDGADRGHESAEPSCRAGVQSRPQRYPLGERKLKRPFMTVGIELVSSEVHRSAVQSLLHLPSTLPSHDRDDLHFPIL